MYDLAGENELDLEALRTRLRRMDDRELLRFGKSVRYICVRRRLTSAKSRGECS